MLAEELFDTPSGFKRALLANQIGFGAVAIFVAGTLVSLDRRKASRPNRCTRGKLLFAPHLGWRDVPVADAL